MTAESIVIDTSVWVEYFRGRRPILYAHIDALVAARRLMNLRIITAELLRGAGTPVTRRAIRETIALIPTVPFSDECWLDVGEFCHQLSRHGVNASLTDGWIAKAVIDHRCALWSLDKDFQHIARIRHIRLYEPQLTSPTLLFITNPGRQRPRRRFRGLRPRGVSAPRGLGLPPVRATRQRAD